ncbi:MAG TPA: hypothetical protein VGR45_12655, partial [Stellaceae bacterium]|nr:hypothetical protein [Stellaceae bacterium]
MFGKIIFQIILRLRGILKKINQFVIEVGLSKSDNRRSLLREDSAMKKLHLLAGTSLLALTAAAPAGWATTFNYTGGLTSFTAPTTGTYDILAFGAQGGAGG